MDQTSAYLERSKSVPIEVIAVNTLLVPPINAALELVTPHLGRVRSMRLHPCFDVSLPAAPSFRSPAPLLQHLEISGFSRGHILRLPRDFLGCHIPSLLTLIWDDSSPIPAPFQPGLPFIADEAPTPLHVVLGLISSAPLLERLTVSIMDENMPLDPSPLHDIRLDSLRYLRLVFGTTLSRALPRFKVPQLEEFSLFLTRDVEAPTIADLLPSDSYPLLTKATSMDFYAGSGNSQVKLSGEGIKVTMGTFLSRMDNFFIIQSFSFAQITRLVLRVVAKPMVVKIGEFINLEQLDLVRCLEEVEVFLTLFPPAGPVSLVLCPRLVGMRVVFCRPTTPTVDSFRRMVRSRKEVGNPLVAIKLIRFYWVEEILDGDELNEWLNQTPIHK